MDHNLTPEEEKLIQALARRQHEAEKAEAELLQKYANRAALAKQLYVLASGVVIAIVTGTLYLSGVAESTKTNAKELVVVRAENNDIRRQLRELENGQHELRLEFTRAEARESSRNRQP